jgi:hypothetical protein
MSSRVTIIKPKASAVSRTQSKKKTKVRGKRKSEEISSDDGKEENKERVIRDLREKSEFKGGPKKQQSRAETVSFRDSDSSDAGSISMSQANRMLEERVFFSLHCLSARDLFIHFFFLFGRL